MSNEDIGIEGPRTLRYFFLMLYVLVPLFMLGIVLNLVYDFPWLEWATRPFIENPMGLLPIAGFLSLIVIGFIIWRFVESNSSHTRRR